MPQCNVGNCSLMTVMTTCLYENKICANMTCCCSTGVRKTKDLCLQDLYVGKERQLKDNMT